MTAKKDEMKLFSILMNQESKKLCNVSVIHPNLTMERFIFSLAFLKELQQATVQIKVSKRYKYKGKDNVYVG